MLMHQTLTIKMVATTKATTATMMTITTTNTTISKGLLDSTTPRDSARVAVATIPRKTLRHLATSQ